MRDGTLSSLSLSFLLSMCPSLFLFSPVSFELMTNDNMYCKEKQTMMMMMMRRKKKKGKWTYRGEYCRS